MKSLIILSIISAVVLADSISAMQFSGIEITYKDKEINVKRLVNPKCKNIGITPQNIFGENLAAKTIPQECKKTFVTSLGTIQPIKIDDEIKTVGELEVLKFLELLEFEPEKYALMDARKSHWYEKLTIPNAINIPYSDIKQDEDFPREYEEILKLLNVKKGKNKKLDFTKAKNVIVFCNASWCVQSVWAVKSLVKLGYPKQKISWFRGGLQDWVGSGFTTVKP